MIGCLVPLYRGEVQEYENEYVSGFEGLDWTGGEGPVFVLTARNIETDELVYVQTPELCEFDPGEHIIVSIGYSLAYPSGRLLEIRKKE